MSFLHQKATYGPTEHHIVRSGEDTAICGASDLHDIRPDNYAYSSTITPAPSCVLCLGIARAWRDAYGRYVQ